MRYLVFSLLLILMPHMAFAQSDSAIGTIMEVEGSATIASGRAAARPAALNIQVHINDIIETKTDSRLMVLFIDDTQMVLSENTRLTVDTFVFDPENIDKNKGVYSVLSGAFQYASGLIAKNTKPDVTIRTPVGSLGIRGTEFFGGRIDGEYGVFVDDGAVAFRTDAGEMLVRSGQGSSVRSRDLRPSVAKVWTPEKLQKARKSVFLKRKKEVAARIAAHKARHPQLRDRYKKAQQRRQQKIEQVKQKSGAAQEQRRPKVVPEIRNGIRKKRQYR